MSEIQNKIYKINQKNKKYETDSDTNTNTNTNSDNNSTENSDTNNTITMTRKKNKDIKIGPPEKIFGQKELCYYKQIDKFFKNIYQESPEKIEKMIDIVNSKSNISLRILDWFSTKYSKKKTSSWMKGGESFDVKVSYRGQLKCFKKKYFDPFRRDITFMYPFENNKYFLFNGENKQIETTLGQLNFFRWAFTNDIVSYVDDNYTLIVAEMNNFNKDEKKKKLEYISGDTENSIKKITKKQYLKKEEEDLKVNVFRTNEHGEIKLVLTFE